MRLVLIAEVTDGATGTSNVKVFHIAHTTHSWRCQLIHQSNQFLNNSQNTWKPNSNKQCVQAARIGQYFMSIQLMQTTPIAWSNVTKEHAQKKNLHLLRLVKLRNNSSWLIRLLQLKRKQLRKRRNLLKKSKSKKRQLQLLKLVRQLIVYAQAIQLIVAATLPIVITTLLIVAATLPIVAATLLTAAATPLTIVGVQETLHTVAAQQTSFKVAAHAVEQSQALHQATVEQNQAPLQVANQKQTHMEMVALAVDQAQATLGLKLHQVTLVLHQKKVDLILTLVIDKKSTTKNNLIQELNSVFTNIFI